MQQDAVEPKSMPSDQSQAVSKLNCIGLLVVHGIGNQARGGPKANAVRAFENAFDLTHSKTTESASVSEFKLTDRVVRVYEV